MTYIVNAEFESIDLADFAAGKLRNFEGVLDVTVYKDKIEQEEADHTVFTNTAMFISSGMITPYLTPRQDVGAYGTERIEPANRRNVILKAEMKDEKSASHVASVFRNMGALSVRINKK